MTDDRELLELARLKELLHYDHETGLFVWAKSNSNRALAGSIAGRRQNSNGYKEIQIDGRLHKAHRLAWFYMHGEWPDQIDHMNGDRTDNRISNLRSVTIEHNNHNQKSAHKNNKTGLLGVSVRTDGKFQAEIRVRRKKIYLGCFSTANDAHSAYMTAKANLHEGALI